MIMSRYLSSRDDRDIDQIDIQWGAFRCLCAGRHRFEKHGACKLLLLSAQDLAPKRADRDSHRQHNGPNQDLSHLPPPATVTTQDAGHGSIVTARGQTKSTARRVT